MARTNNLTNFLTDVSAAIKQKIGDNTPIPAANFDTEILSIETAGTYQDKTLSITTNGNYRLEPDQNFDAMSSVSITVSVPTGEDLETEISAQEEYIAQLESIIDTKTSGGGSEPNIFVQETEPDVKKGIWLQTDKIVEHYTYDDEVYIAGEWEPDGIHADIPYNFNNGAAISMNTDIYLFGSANSGNYRYAYKYDTLTNTYTRLADIPGSYNTDGITPAIVGTDIYLFGGNGSSSACKMAYKYDTLTDTYTRLTDIPMEFTDMTATAIGTDIYLLSGAFLYNSYSKMAYKYDTLTNTYTRLTDSPYSFLRGSAVAVDNDIYIFGGSSSKTTTYKYNTLTDTYTQLNSIPYDFYGGNITLIGTDIYLFGGSTSRNSTYKYDILTDTYIQLTNIPYYEFYAGAAVSVGTNNYLFKGYKVQVYALQSKTYQQDNLVVVEQGKYKGAGYSIELYNNPKDVDSPKYQFVDAWFYTTNDGLITDIPTYYGDGTQWVNFKNPPTPVPPKYIPLEYIQATGTQYIDTNYYVTPTTRIVIDIQFTSTDAQQRAFGATISNSSQTGGLRTYLYLNSYGTFGWNLQDNSNNNVNTNVNIDTNRHIFDLDSYNNVMSMDNGDTYTSTITTTRTNNGLVPLYLLTLNQYNMAEYTMWNAKAKLYNCKIYDNNVLVHDFIPVTSEYGVVCLYDKVSNQFFTNQGTGTFVAGPEKEVEE